MNPDANKPITSADLTAIVGTTFADLEVLSLGRALDALAIHAAMMDNRDEDVHAGCLECNVTVLLARVVHFGDQLRDAERRRS